MVFEELVRRISPTLKRIVSKVNNNHFYFDKDDLYQEVLLHLWEDFSQLKLNDKTDSYILQGCYFYLKNYLRKTKDKAKLVSIDILIDEEDKVNLEDMLYIEDQANFVDYLSDKMLLEKIKNNGLTKREKEVLGLYLEGLTLREIGRRLGISHVRVAKIKANIKRKSGYLKSEYYRLPK